METKQLLTGIIIVMSAFLLIILMVIGLYFIYPPILGIEPSHSKKQDSLNKHAVVVFKDTVPVVPTVAITESKLKDFQLNIVQKNALTKERDSLVNFAKILNDSMNKIMFKDKFHSDTLNKYSKNLSEAKNFTNKLLDSILRIQQQLKKSLEKAQSAEQKIKDQESFIAQKQDSSEAKNFAQFAKIYNGSNPADVAKILEQIDERDASKIIKLMSVKKAGKVLEAMKPEVAAAILLIGGSQ